MPYSHVQHRCTLRRRYSIHNTWHNLVLRYSTCNRRHSSIACRSNICRHRNNTWNHILRLWAVVNMVEAEKEAAVEDADKKCSNYIYNKAWQSLPGFLILLIKKG